MIFLTKPSSFILLIFLCLVFQPDSSMAQQCNCQEYLYLNDTELGQVRKYSIDANATLTEINPGGPWYPNNNVSELPRPHGISFDLNGNLYISGSNTGTPQEQYIRRLNCNGEITPVSEFFIPETNTTHIASYENFILTNGLSSGGSRGIQIWDACTGDFVGKVPACDANNSFSNGNWGMTYDPVNDLLYQVVATAGVFTINVFDPKDPAQYTARCTQPLFSGTAADPLQGSFGRLLGIAVNPANGDVYVVRTDNFFQPSAIARYDSNGNFIYETPTDSVDGDGGWFGTGDIVYSASCDCIISVSRSRNDDCAYAWNLDLTEIGPIIPPVSQDPNVGVSKAANVVIECCPVNPTETISSSVCVENTDELVFLNEIWDCEGPVCGEGWVPNGVLDGLTYNDCNQSVQATGAGGCGSFSIISNPGSQCGAFNLTIDLCVNVTVPCIRQFGDFTINKRRP